MKLKRPVLIGDLHNEISQKIVKIFLVQNEREISDGIKGFILHGPPGTGKSTIAKWVISDVVAKTHLEHFPDDQLYVLLNLADIAKARFGETEDIIRENFESAMKIAKNNGNFFIIVMDDVEGMFPTRSYQKLDAWYLGHLNVLFTELDKLETDKVGIIMTTNRRDLLDDAVISRLVDFEVPFINIETAKMKIESRIKELKMDNDYIEIVLNRINKKIKDGTIENLSFRDVEKEMMFAYLEWIDAESE